MKFLYEYRTSDNVTHSASVCASDREAAFSKLKAQGIKPAKVVEAPGFFNKLFGKGKRWIAISVLGVLCLVLGAVVIGRARTSASAQALAFDEFDGRTRRQLIGDAAVIDEGIRTGWTDVFPLEGERFLASFAVPGVPAGLRNTTEKEINDALTRRVAAEEGDSIEARQIKAMVEGMKDELREFLKDGGTIQEYGRELVRRQEQEVSYYQRAKREVENAIKSKRPQGEVADLIRERNARLRKLGIKLVVLED